MDNFTFYSPTLFAFGDGEGKNVGALVRRFGGTRVLLVYGGGSSGSPLCRTLRRAGQSPQRQGLRGH